MRRPLQTAHQRKWIMYLILPVLLFSFTSCEDQDDFADDLLYGDELLYHSWVHITVNRVTAFTTGFNNQLYGFDVFVRNTNQLAMQNVSVSILGIFPRTNYLTTSSQNLFISAIQPTQNLKPQYTWNFWDPNTGQQVYIGNFYMTFSPSTPANQSYEINFQVSYTYNGYSYTATIPVSFSTTSSRSTLNVGL